MIWRHLMVQGLHCEVVAPSSIARAPGERIKTDRRDALLLARLARMGKLAVMRVPDAVNESVCDLVRARENAVHEQRNGRHRRVRPRARGKPLRCCARRGQ
jgi:transposase